MHSCLQRWFLVTVEPRLYVSRCISVTCVNRHFVRSVFREPLDIRFGLVWNNYTFIPLQTVLQQSMLYIFQHYLPALTFLKALGTSPWH